MHMNLNFLSSVYQLAMSSHDNATPIRILHNSAAHLGGYARCLGAILMGYLGKLSHDNATPIRILHSPLLILEDMLDVWGQYSWDT